MLTLPFIRRPIAAMVALSLLTAGCVTNPDGSITLDDKAKGALLGAAAGCGIAVAAGQECAQGAVVGAVAGFLIGWYFESKKLADAKVVNQEYTKSKVIPPKNDIVPAAFTTKVADSPVDADGQKEVKITSNTDMIGYGDKVPEVQQKYALYDENNKLVDEKTEKLASVDGAGRYQSTSKFKLPAEAKGKGYTVKTSLVSNKKTYKENSYKVAFDNNGHVMVLAMAQ